MNIREELPASAVADAGGTALVVFNGPSSGVLAISSVAVYVDPGSPMPVATMYDGPVPTPGRVLATLRAGDRGTFRADVGDVLVAGQQLCIEWTGAAAGATCRAVLRGTTTRR